MTPRADEGDYTYEFGLSKQVGDACHAYLLQNDAEYAKKYRRRSAMEQAKIAKRKKKEAQHQ